MNEFEDFERLVDALLIQLELPIVSDEEKSQLEADIVDMRLAVMFPNLSAQERSGIAGVHLARAVAQLASGTTRDELSTEQGRKLIATTAAARISHQRALDALERYGLRAKLTHFQERLLSHLCGGDGLP